MGEVDCLVVGAGVIGLAVARALALSGREVVVIEAGLAIGAGISSRNSEVIHAGLYYPPGSLKAATCLEGQRLLYAFCASHNIAHRRCGKLVVAHDDAELDQLEAIAARAKVNGVTDLRLIDADQARALEPAVTCAGALLSPSTGIIDSHGYMSALRGDAEAAGAMVALASPMLRAEPAGQGWRVEVGGDEPMVLKVAALVNAAGLEAAALARRIDGLAPEHVPTAYFAKGSYMSLSAKAPFERLIYPAPVPGGLGVHLTLDLGGQAKFGPDVEWVSAPDYTVDPARAAGFYAAIRRYWPGLPDGALQPGYAGVRPKITPPGAPAADFVIQGPQTHGAAGLVNLFGIESPGLTASLALAERVRTALADT